MSLRQNALNEWLLHTHQLTDYTLTPLAGDASFRRYFRLKTQDKRYIIMDAPPDRENLALFISVSQILKTQGIHVPDIAAFDTLNGFALLEDLGDTLLSTHLCADNQQTRYRAALNTLIQIQQCPLENAELPYFDIAFMTQEMNLFKTWFLEGLLHITLTPAEEKELMTTFNRIASNLIEQPKRFIHRDYHSRNLMIIEQQGAFNIGVIDFQDAMVGPFTYDLASLIKDCYIDWPEEIRQPWVSYFYHHLPDSEGWSFDEFQQGLDWCGLQRHLKVLGVFSRLHLRDNKSTYLKDLPLTLKHALHCITQYDVFYFLQEIIETRILPEYEQRQPA